MGCIGHVNQAEMQAAVDAIGQVLHPSYLSLVGDLTLDAIERLNADIAFLGTSGVRPDGTVLDSTGTEVPIKRAILGRSGRRYLLASADKFPGSGVLPVCQVDAFTDVITTADPGTAPLAELAERIPVAHV